MPCCGGGTTIWLKGEEDLRKAVISVWYGEKELHCSAEVYTKMRPYLLMQADVWQTEGYGPVADRMREVVAKLDSRLKQTPEGLVLEPPEIEAARARRRSGKIGWPNTRYNLVRLALMLDRKNPEEAAETRRHIAEGDIEFEYTPQSEG